MPLGRGFCEGGELPSGRTASKGDCGLDVRPIAVLSRGSVCGHTRRCARDSRFPASPASMLTGMALGTVLAMPCRSVAGQFPGMIEPMTEIMLGRMMADMAVAIADSTDAAFGPSRLPDRALGVRSWLAALVPLPTGCCETREPNDASGPPEMEPVRAELR